MISKLKKVIVIDQNFIIKNTKAPFFIFFVGCLIGFLKHLSLQDGIYNSQIVVNLSDYAKTDLMYIWGINLWSVMSQISGSLLLVGINELTQSIVLSILLSGLSFCSLFLIIKSITKDSLYSAALVLLCYYSRHYLHGLSYEVSMSSWDFFNSTWGNFGFHLGLLSLGLILNNFQRVGYFLLGAMLSVHFFIGFFLLSTVGFTILVVKRDHVYLRSILKWFLFGVIFSFCSYMINSFQYGVIDQAGTGVQFTEFISGWDNHREVNFRYLRSAVLLNLLFFSYFSYLLFIKKKSRDLVVSWLYSLSLISCLIILCYTLDIFRLFPSLNVAMPERMLNFIYYLSFPVLCCFRKERERVISLILFFIIVSFDYIFSFFNHELSSLIAFLGILVCAYIWSTYVWKARESVQYRKVCFFIITALLLTSLLNLNFFDRIKRINESFTNERNNFLKTKDGMLLVSPLHISSKVQLLTRRKILIDVTELAEISYAFHTYSKANSIMNEVFNIELNDGYSSLFVIHNGVETVSPDYVKKIWEGRSTREWNKIFEKYKITQVLVPSSWVLNLKSVYKDSTDQVYEN